MKIEATCEAREGTKSVDVEGAYRVRVVGRNGEVIEVVEQMGGGFLITAVTSIGCKLTVEPIAQNAIIVGAKR